MLDHLEILEEFIAQIERGKIKPVDIEQPFCSSKNNQKQTVIQLILTKYNRLPKNHPEDSRYRKCINALSEYIRAITMHYLLIRKKIKPIKLTQAQQSNQEKCAICYSLYLPKNNLVQIADCAHHFHTDCFNKLCSRYDQDPNQQKFTCSYCRKVLLEK